VHNPAEADWGIAANLLDSTLVEGRNCFLVVPVFRRRVREYSFTTVDVGQLDHEFRFLISDSAVGLELEATRNKLCASIC
jgi:hypothetical protein